MIITRLMGGLGNQMFQYAAGRSLAAKSGGPLKLDVSGYEHQKGVTLRHYALEVFAVQEAFANQEEMSYIRGRALLRKLGIPKRGFFSDKDGAIPAVSRGQDAYLDGYWQSEKYFADIRDILLKEFSLKDEFNHLPQDMLSHMVSTGSIALHVRRGDYVNDKATLKFHGLCPPEYYDRAIRLIASKVSDAHFFVFSDDIKWTREHIAIGHPATYVSDGKLKGFEEMMLMGSCKHAIIANSSFSWWGAWLIRNESKIVIAPKKWFANQRMSSRDIIPESWTAL